MYQVYILQSLKDRRTYVGYASNFEKRFRQHNDGQVRWTKSRLPLRVLLLENFETRLESKTRELWWKSTTGRRRLKSLLELSSPS